MKSIKLTFFLYVIAFCSLSPACSLQAAQVLAIERAPASPVVHVLIDEGILHGYQVGKTVCVYSSVGEKIICTKLKQANELYSLIAVEGADLEKISINQLVVPSDFVALKPKIAKVCQEAGENKSASAIPDDELFAFELFRKDGLVALCSDQTSADRKLNWQLSFYAVQILVPETQYNRVGFLTRSGSGQQNLWGSRASEARPVGYGSSVQITQAAGTYVQFSFRSLGPAQEDLKDTYSTNSNDIVRSRTTYESNGLGVSYQFSRHLGWVRFDYGAGLDYNSSNIAFKSYRSGTTDQVLAIASSKQTVIGVSGDTRVNVMVGPVAVVAGLQALLPAVVVAKDYTEDVGDIENATGQAKVIQPKLAHDKAQLGLSAQFGLSMMF